MAERLFYAMYIVVMFSLLMVLVWGVGSELLSLWVRVVITIFSVVFFFLFSWITFPELR